MVRQFLILKAAVALAVALVVVLSGCGSSSNSSSSSDTGSSASGKTSTPTGSKHGPEIVWLEIGSGNPYWDASHKAAAGAAKKLGFRFRVVDGNSDASTQGSVMRQLINQKVDTIMVNPVDPKAIHPAIVSAEQKGIKVVNLYGSDPAATANIGFDEARSGRIAAENAVKVLQQRYGKAQGTIAVLAGINGQPASDDRVKGFTDYMKSQPGVKVVSIQPTDWAADKASATMQSWLTKYPDLSMVYAASDTIAVPAMNVAQRQNRLCTQQRTWKANASCVIFVSVDGNFINEVVNGRLFSTELYSAEWTGYTYAALAAKVAFGKSFSKENNLESLLVTPANAKCIAKFQNDMAKNVTTFDFTGTLQQIATQRYHCQ